MTKCRVKMIGMHDSNWNMYIITTCSKSSKNITERGTEEVLGTEMEGQGAAPKDGLLNTSQPMHS